MPLPAFVAPVLTGFLRKVFGGIVFGKAFGWIKTAFSKLFGKKPGVPGAPPQSFFGGIWGKFLGFFEAILAGAGMMELVIQGFKRIVGWIGVGGAVVSGGANVNQVWHLLENIADPQSAVLDWLADALSQLPSIPELISRLDGLISSMTVWQYISPVPTVTNMLQITGVGYAFNQILMSMIQNMIFIFSVFVVRWGFSSNFTFTKSVSRKAKT